MSNFKIHKAHCYQNEYKHSCKYGESDCPEKPKVYLKGTKIRLHCCTHDYGSNEYEDIILDEDTSEREIEELAREFMYNTKEPEYWFEEV